MSPLLSCLVFLPLLELAGLADVCKQTLSNFCFGNSSSPPPAFCHTWLQPLIYTAWLLAITAAGGPGQAPGGMSAGAGQAQCREGWSMEGWSVEGWSVGAVGASAPLQIGVRGITDSLPAPVQRTMFKHDCDDVLK